MSVISIANAKVAEGPPGSKGMMRFVVSLSAPAAQVVTVDYTTTDSLKAKLLATTGVDYTAKAGTLSFAIGQVERYVDIDIIGDSLVEGDEAFDLLL
jgi:hypothetical protein